MVICIVILLSIIWDLMDLNAFITKFKSVLDRLNKEREKLLVIDQKAATTTINAHVRCCSKIFTHDPWVDRGST